MRHTMRWLVSLGLLTVTACGDDGAPADGSTTSATGTGDEGSSGPTAGTLDPDGSGGGSGESSGGTPACGEGATGCAPALWQPAGATRASSIPGGCGEGSFSLQWSWEVPGIDAAKAIPLVVDVDGDGVLDLVMSARKTDGLVFPGLGDGSFGAPGSMGVTFLGGWAFDAGDIDGNGTIDLALGDHNHGALSLSGSGTGTFAPAGGTMPEGTYSGAGLGDLDGDGALDAVFGADQFNSGFAVALGAGGGLQATPVTGMPAFGAGGPANNGTIRMADLDDDGDLDVVAFGQGGGGALEGHPFLNDGSGTSYTSAGALVGPAGTGGVGIPVQGSVGDVDCDGRPDAAVGGVVWLGGEAGFTAGPSLDGALISHLADLDGDGWLDLVTHSSEGGLRAYLGDGTAFVETELGLPGPDYVPPEHVGEADLIPLDDAMGIEIDDLDGDGSLEIVRWYKMSIPGAFGGETTYHRAEVWGR